MFLFLKNYFKENFSHLYEQIRHVFFPFYAKVRFRSLKKFTEKILYYFSYSGIRFNIYLDPKNGFIDNEIFWKGVYEEGLLDFLQSQIKADDVYLDIGANIGQHALFVSHLVTQGAVYAFEPNASIYTQFKDSVEANSVSNIHIYNMGLGKETKQETLFINTENVGGSSMLSYKDEMKSVTIYVEKGDEVLQRADVKKVDFIKLDVEGYEYEVLLGLSHVISTNKPKMIVEFTPVFYNKKGSSDARDIVLFLCQRGYKFRDLESYDTSKVYSTEGEMLGWVENLHKDQTNIFCFI